MWRWNGDITADFIAKSLPWLSACGHIYGGCFISQYISSIRVRLNIKKSYQYRNSHYAYKTVSRSFYLYNENPIHGKTVFTWRRGPDRCKADFNWMVFQCERLHNQAHLATPSTIRVTFGDDPKGFVGGWDHLQTGDIVSFVMKAADVRIMVMSHGSTARILCAVSETWSICWLWSLKFPKQRRHTFCVWKMTCVHWAALLAAHKHWVELGQNCHQLQYKLEVSNARHDETLRH